MMNKLVNKTLKKGKLMSLIMGIVLALSILFTAIFGINYSANLKSGKTLTVSINRFFYDNSLSLVEDVCEAEFDDADITVKYTQQGEMSGDECEIMYVFADKVSMAKLQEVEEAIENKIADILDKAENGTDAEKTQFAAWLGADITVSSHSESVKAGIPFSYFLRAFVGVMITTILAFIYVWIRYKLHLGILAAICSLLSAVMTTAVLFLFRIPFAHTMVYTIALAPLFTLVMLLFTLSNFRAKRKDGTDVTEENVVSCVATKEILVFASTIAAMYAIVGVIVVGGISWIALSAIITLAISTFIAWLFAPAIYLPIKKKADAYQAERVKNGYVGAKKKKDKAAKKLEELDEKVETEETQD